MGTFRARGGLAGGRSNYQQAMPCLKGNTCRTYRKTTSGTSQKLGIVNLATGENEMIFELDCDSNVYWKVGPADTVEATNDDNSTEHLSTDEPLWVSVGIDEDVAVIDKS